MKEESGDDVERLIDEPQAIEHHRFDGFPHGEVSHFRVLTGRLVDDVTNAKFVEHACDKAEVIQDLATVSGLVGHHNLLCWWGDCKGPPTGLQKWLKSHRAMRKVGGISAEWGFG